MNDLRRRKEEAWQLLGALGWPQELGDALGGTPGGASLSYAEYMASLSPLKWLRLRETSGTNVANSGSVAGDGTWTAGTGAIGVTGQLGANEAYTFDAAASRIAMANANGYIDIPAFTYAGLVYPTSGGEGNTGRLWDIGSFRRYVAALTANFATIQSIVRSTGNAASNTSNGLTLNAWQWVFMTYDDAGDRKIHLYKGIGGAVTEFLYATQTAATGTMTPETEIFGVGNNGVSNATFGGNYDEFYALSGVQSAASMLQVVQLSGL